MNRTEKQTVVASLKEKLESTGTVVVVHNQGLTVAEISALRKEIRQGGSGFQVTKNSLLKLAIKGTDYEHLDGLLTGPTAIAYSEDPVSAAKAVVEFGNDNEKLVILGGAMGAEAMDINKVKALAKLPSLNELRAKLISMIQTPATRIAGVVQAPGGQLARVFNAYAATGEGDA